MEDILITSSGIQKNLKKVKPTSAICEYIWNGFDAGATCVDVVLEKNNLDMVDRIIIKDNGSGIDYNLLSQKFKPFNDSEKYRISSKQNNKTIPHGKNGVGRLTFFVFSTIATWKTVYNDNGNNKEYTIEIDRESLNRYEPKNLIDSDKSTGTTVCFENVSGIDEKLLIQSIHNEFFWFIKIWKKSHLSIRVNGEEIDFEKDIKEEFDIYHIEGVKHEIKIHAFLWNIGLGNEYSKVYYFNSKGEEVYKENTTLNKKSDNFYHSVVVQSDYFDSFSFEKNQVSNQVGFLANCEDEEFKCLFKGIMGNLIAKRKQYLKKASSDYISKLVESKIYPDFEKNTILGKFKKDQLDSIVEALYTAEPKIFTALNTPQKKIFIRLLNTILESNEKDGLFNIIDNVIGLEDDEINDFANILKDTTLNHITSTIKLLEDRVKAVQALKEIVFNKEFNAREVEHVQSIVERHYWLFGEQYHLLTSTEPDFNQALQQLIAFKTGEDEEVNVDHEDAQKEMDIFMVKQGRSTGIYENVVVELKRPKVSLGEKQLSQLKRYMRVIMADDRFNSPDSQWTYILVGNKFDKSGYIEGEIESHKNLGEKNLVHTEKNHKIFVMTWSQIFENFSTNHDFLLNKLTFKQEVWLQTHSSADAAVEDVVNNSASLEKFDLLASNQ